LTDEIKRPITEKIQAFEAAFEIRQKAGTVAQNEALQAQLAEWDQKYC